MQLTLAIPAKRLPINDKPYLRALFILFNGDLAQSAAKGLHKDYVTLTFALHPIR